MRGLPDDRCQSPHWGYVVAGSLTFRFADHDETYEAGDAYYAPPGHIPVVTAGAEVVEFSPTEAYARTMGGPRPEPRRARGELSGRTWAPGRPPAGGAATKPRRGGVARPPFQPAPTARWSHHDSPAQLKGFVTMSATTRSSTAVSTRATSRIFWIAATVSGASGPFSVNRTSTFFASGERTAMPVTNVAA